MPRNVGNHTPLGGLARRACTEEGTAHAPAGFCSKAELLQREGQEGDLPRGRGLQGDGEMKPVSVERPLMGMKVQGGGVAARGLQGGQGKPPEPDSRRTAMRKLQVLQGWAGSLQAGWPRRFWGRRAEG